MINFSTHETQVKVEISTDHGQMCWLYWECNHKMLASLLRQHMHDKLNRELNVIRKEAYEKGWKDAKGRKKKETWFSSWWRK